MSSTVVAFAVVAFLCILFRWAMRWIGLVAVFVLFYLYPVPLTALLVVGGVAFFLLTN